jgi:hypothetical protein
MPTTILYDLEKRVRDAEDKMHSQAKKMHERYSRDEEKIKSAIQYFDDQLIKVNGNEDCKRIAIQDRYSATIKRMTQMYRDQCESEIKMFDLKNDASKNYLNSNKDIALNKLKILREKAPKGYLTAESNYKRALRELETFRNTHTPPGTAGETA